MEFKDEEQKELYEKTKKILLITLIVLLFLLSGILFIITNRLGNIVILKMFLGDSTSLGHNTSENVSAGVSLSADITTPKHSYNNQEQHLERFAIISNVGVWESNKSINVFDNSEYNYAPIIAPGDTGEYLFTVENYLTDMIKYDIEFSEQNLQKMNIKYKLKLNNQYIIGDTNTWVDISELNQNDIKIPDATANVYTLEWCWIEQTNEIDTALVGAKYLLLIKINANEVTND